MGHPATVVALRGAEVPHVDAAHSHSHLTPAGAGGLSASLHSGRMMARAYHQKPKIQKETRQACHGCREQYSITARAEYTPSVAGPCQPLQYHGSFRTGATTQNIDRPRPALSRPDCEELRTAFPCMSLAHCASAGICAALPRALPPSPSPPLQKSSFWPLKKVQPGVVDVSTSLI